MAQTYRRRQNNGTILRHKGRLEKIEIKFKGPLTYFN